MRSLCFSGEKEAGLLQHTKNVLGGTHRKNDIVLDITELGG
jgi:hypothetical protein